MAGLTLELGRLVSLDNPRVKSLPSRSLRDTRLEDKTMIAPLPHLNGDRKETLSDMARAAAEAVQTAREAVASFDVNVRNYYVISPTAHKQAVEEHVARLRKLSEVSAELCALWEAIEDGRTEFEVVSQ